MRFATAQRDILPLELNANCARLRRVHERERERDSSVGLSDWSTRKLRPWEHRASSCSKSWASLRRVFHQRDGPVSRARARRTRLSPARIGENARRA